MDPVYTHYSAFFRNDEASDNLRVSESVVGERMSLDPRD